MRVEHLNAFLGSLNNVMGMVAGITLDVNSTKRVESPIKSKGVAVSIGVTGDLRGNVIINMTHDTFFATVSNMMGYKTNVSDELTKSAIGELFNMTLGGVSSAYYEMGLKTNITPPSIAEGLETVFSISGSPMLCVSMGKGDIAFDIYLSLKETK